MVGFVAEVGVVGFVVCFDEEGVVECALLAREGVAEGVAEFFPLAVVECCFLPPFPADAAAAAAAAAASSASASNLASSASLLALSSATATSRAATAALHIIMAFCASCSSLSLPRRSLTVSGGGCSAEMQRDKPLTLTPSQ